VVLLVAVIARLDRANQYSTAASDEPLSYSAKAEPSTLRLLAGVAQQRRQYLIQLSNNPTVIASHRVARMRAR
jgi:hypothetical protein